MKIEVKIDDSCAEPKIVIMTDRMTDEVNDIIDRLSEKQPQMIAGFRDGQATLLDATRIYRVYASGGKVYAETADGTYILRMRLYEAEQRLTGRTFVRISNSEVINLKKVKGFDLSFAGTICVSLSNGSVTYVSRRYVSKIKQLLEI